MAAIACADLIPERAEAKAKEFDIPKACSVDELLQDPDIQIVINLTIPKAHAEVANAALEAGKHVYVKKLLVVTREDGERVLKLAQTKGLLADKCKSLALIFKGAPKNADSLRQAIRIPVREPIVDSTSG